jgi:hypothetical protein
VVLLYGTRSKDGYSKRGLFLLDVMVYSSTEYNLEVQIPRRMREWERDGKWDYRTGQRPNT